MTKTFYDPANWYWSGPLGVFSSARNEVVPAADAAYEAWIAAGSVPTNWPRDATGSQTVEALDDVLTSAGLSPSGLAAPTQAHLIAYANEKQWALATGGYTVTVEGVAYRFATDVVSLNMMDGKVARLSQPNPPASFNWQIGSAWLVIAAADFPSIATACADFVQSTFDALKTIEPQIVSGAITTEAEVDAAAWPA